MKINGAESSQMILVVEDDEGLNRLAQKKLNQAGFETTGVIRGAEVLEKVRKDQDLVMVLDYMLPDMTAEDVIKSLAEKELTIPFIMMSGRGNEKIAVQMMKLGARDYIVKDTTFLDFLPQVVTKVVDTIQTERKLAETEHTLRESENKYHLVIENAKDGIYILQDDRFVFVNDAFCDMFGYTRNEILDLTSIMALVDEESHELINDRTEKLKKGEEVEDQYEFVGKKKNGEKLHLDTSIGLINFQGRPARQGMIRDITERKIAEEKKQELEKMKSDFMLLVSHELGTPLMVVGLSLEHLVDSHKVIDDEEFRSVVDKINLNLARIKKLKYFMSNMILLEQGKFEPQMTPVFLHHIARQSMDELSLIARDKEIEIIFEVPDLDIVMADKERIHEVLSTIIDNAIRYTPVGGRIVISGKQTTDEVEMTVCDNGIGIAQELQESIFERFFQIQDILSHKDGFGLGLSIARGIIHSHNGIIWVESEFRKGSSFHFSLPKIQPKVEANS